MKLFSGKRLKLVFLSLLSVLVSGSLWTYSISASDETLPVVSRERFYSRVTVEDLDIEYTVTGGTLESIHVDVPQTYVYDGTNNGYTISAAGIKLKNNNGIISNYTDVHITPDSGNLWKISAHSFDIDGNDITYSAQVENLHCSYKLVENVVIGFNVPVTGWCGVDFTVPNGRTWHSIKVGDKTDVSYRYNGSTRTGTMWFYGFGSSFLSADFIEYHLNETSLPSTTQSRFLNFDESTWDYGNLVVYEEPVKDVGSHNLLQKILDALLDNNDNGAAQQQVNEIKDTAENKMGGISDATELVEQGFQNLQGDAVNQLTFPGLFGGDSWTMDLGYIEQQAPELVAIMRTILIAAVAWGCYEMLKSTVLGNRV